MMTTLLVEGLVELIAFKSVLEKLLDKVSFGRKKTAGTSFEAPHMIRELSVHYYSEQHLKKLQKAEEQVQHHIVQAYHQLLKTKKKNDPKHVGFPCSYADLHKHIVGAKQKESFPPHVYPELRICCGTPAVLRRIMVWMRYVFVSMISMKLFMPN